MVKWKQTGFVVAVGVIAFVAGRAIPVTGGVSAAQPEKKADKPAQPEKKADKPGDAVPEMPKPGSEHRVLDALVGTFEGGVKMWPAPGAEPMESKGTVKREWILDGHFVKEDVVGSMMGQEGAFKGLGLVGYNQGDKQYESVWLENMGFNISMSTGTYDATKKVFTFVGDMVDHTGKKTKVTSTIDVSNPDREVMTGTCPGPDGKPFKNFEGVFERKKK